MNTGLSWGPIALFLDMFTRGGNGLLFMGVSLLLLFVATLCLYGVYRRNHFLAFLQTTAFLVSLFYPLHEH